MTTNTAARTANATVSFYSMFKHAVVDANDKPFGRMEDAVLLLREDQYPLFIGVVVIVDGQSIYLPVSEVTGIEASRIQLGAVRAELRPFERRDGQALVKQDVLGHRLVDVDRRALVKAYDIRLTLTAEGWTATGLDVHKHSWFSFGGHENHPARDWHAFLLLAGTHESLKTRFASNWIRRFKPAQIADLIEGASLQEQNLLLAQVHSDPQLEAHVFEELDDDRQATLLKSRSDQDVADILSRMRADDVADALMDLPQGRRRNILDLLPQPQNTKVLALLGYHDATAGGLMGTEYLAVPEDQSIAAALLKLRAATTQQPEALTTIHSLRTDGTLAGTLGLVRALQLDPATALRDAADPDIVFALPEEDIIAVTTRMADFNLLTLPVLDQNGKILGIVTVDDALEVAIPRAWYLRGPSTPTPRIEEA